MTGSPLDHARQLAELVAAHSRRSSPEPESNCLPADEPPPWDRPSHDELASNQAFRLATQLDYDAHQLGTLRRQALACGALAARGLPLNAAQQRVLVESANPFCRDLLRACFGLAAGEGASALASHPSEARFLAELRDTLRCWAELPDPAAASSSCFEWLLAQSDRSHRRRRGVYYTPRPLARFLVQQVDEVLQTSFGLLDGLADTATWGQHAKRAGCNLPPPVHSPWPFVTLLDPAAGTGVFLQESVLRIHRTLAVRWRAEGCSEGQIAASWNRYVPNQLLPRLWGLELMLPALVVSHLQLAATLLETGYEFSRPARFNLMLSNTLAGSPGDTASPPEASAWTSTLPLRDESQAVQVAAQVRHGFPFTVIVGNPPFASFSANSGEWIRQLLKGHDGTVERANYYHCAGRPLGERKHWLQDDYVKFLRYAHWQIERAGTGVVGLVTNHGFLDNATFRGLREQLLSTFPLVRILDLHGNRKNGETAPDGAPDENVFGIDSGVAATVLVRPPAGAPTQRGYCNLWGSREEKLQVLDSGLRQGGRSFGASDDAVAPDKTAPGVGAEEIELQPTAPYFLLVPDRGGYHAEYQRSPPLTEVMPVSTTAPVTARDGLVVARRRDELLERIARFRDPSVPDALIRAEFFRRRRSWRYPPGDTRGWKLTAARQTLAELDDWTAPAVSCLYRPFDFRWIYWLPAMIDWPRTDLMRQLRQEGNLALITRRQMLPDQPCSYFWVCDRIALDGVIRSDNRGSESLFPLYLSDPPEMAPAVLTGPREAAAGSKRANFSRNFVEALSQRVQLAWLPVGRGDLQRDFGPEDALSYIYGLFHSPSYRTRFQTQLAREFPRVLLPPDRQGFHEFARLGSRLIDLHLLRRETESESRLPRLGPLPTRAERSRDEPGRKMSSKMGRKTDLCPDLASDPVVQRRHLAYRDGAVAINPLLGFHPVERSVWEFRAGGYQVAHKWLADRNGSCLEPAEIREYARLLDALSQTGKLMQQADQLFQSVPAWRPEPLAP